MTQSDALSSTDARTRIKELELQGYTIMPNVLGEDQVGDLHTALGGIELRRSSYTDKQRFAHGVQWSGIAAVWDLVQQPITTRFLGDLFGDELACVGVSCSRSDPGYPGMPLHTDSHPYGSNIMGAAGTPPVLVRVLYYLNDLLPDRAPLRVVPYSHLSLHADAMPYGRYQSDEDELILTCRAGNAIVINQRLFHGVGPNLSDASRSLIAVSYRPAWASPTHPLPEPSRGTSTSFPPPCGRSLTGRIAACAKQRSSIGRRTCQWVAMGSDRDGGLIAAAISSCCAGRTKRPVKQALARNANLAGTSG